MANIDSSSNKKTIKINPELFKISGSKSKTKTEKKLPSQPLLINSNSLKKQFLSRIKEHKTRETQLHDITASAVTIPINNNNTIDESPDEFYESINYLNSLSKKHKYDDDKLKYEKKQREQIAKKNG